MRATRIVLFLFGAWLLAATAMTARIAAAQEGEGLSDVLSDLLRGAEGEAPTAGPDRRIPFGCKRSSFPLRLWSRKPRRRS